MRHTAHLSRAPVTKAAMAFANAMLAAVFPSLAGTGTSQQGPSIRAAISGAASSIASLVGIFKFRAVRRMAISSWLGVRQPSPTYLETYLSLSNAFAD